MTMTSNAAAPALEFALTSAWPQVDLLPPEVRAGRRLKRAKRRLLLGVALILLAALAAYAATLFSAAAAQVALVEVQNETSRLTSEQAKYAEVPQVLGDIASAEQARQLGTSTEILWKPYLDAIRAVTPTGVSIGGLTVTTATPMQPAQLAANPLAASSLGQIAFTAKSLTVPDTSDWLDALDSVPGFADAWFSAETLTEQEGVIYYEVAATVQVNDEALANRFALGEGN